MRCPQCGMRVAADANFCEHCGLRVTEILRSTLTGTEIESTTSARKKTIILSLVVVMFGVFAFVVLYDGLNDRPVPVTRRLFQIGYEAGYLSGYGGGDQEREEGYPYEPEKVFAQPELRAGLSMITSDLTRNLTAGEKRQFFSGFKEGRVDGFNDGYYRRPFRPKWAPAGLEYDH